MLKTMTLAFLLVGCQTVTIRPGGGEKLATEPDYQERINFMWWGLSPGQVSVDLNTVCGGKTVEQIQSRNNALDVVFGGLTLGIYAPRSARVWCSGASEKNDGSKTKNKEKA